MKTGGEDKSTMVRPSQKDNSGCNHQNSHGIGTRWNNMKSKIQEELNKFVQDAMNKYAEEGTDDGHNWWTAIKGQLCNVLEMWKSLV